MGVYCGFVVGFYFWVFSRSGFRQGHDFLGVWELNLFGQIVVSHDLAKQKESSVETLPLPRLELAPPGAGREDARSIRRFAGFS